MKNLFQRRKDKIKDYRIGEENVNFQGCLMKISKYNSAGDIYVEFQDNYKSVIHAAYREFKNGKIKNPYYPDVYNVGVIGLKYKAFENSKDVREYKIWHSILQRCYDTKTQTRQPTYAGCFVSERWKFYENFYEWVHEQNNYEKWNKNEIRWSLDKDIIFKGNKMYSSDTCCLIPEYVNVLFTKRQNDRGKYPIGVYYYKAGNCFRAQCMNPILSKRVLIGSYTNPIDAFYAYKEYKENLIKSIAKIEFQNKNIIEQCFYAMMNYKVEITD